MKPFTMGIVLGLIGLLFLVAISTVVLSGCSDHHHTFISPVVVETESPGQNGCPNQSGRCPDVDSTVVDSLP